MVKSVKEIKDQIKMYLLPECNLKTNFSSEDFLVELDNKLIIIAKPIIENNKVIYKFMLDIQFLSSKEISYDEIVMVKNIIDVLESNKNFVLSKFKKYTVEEFLEENKIREEQSKKMFEALEKALLIMHAKKDTNE